MIPPIGVRLARTARLVSHEFETAMAEAGGSGPTWQVLLLVKAQQWDTQSAMADAMGVNKATLTHHLNALEKKGLVRRWRDADNRRAQQAELTAAGDKVFARLRKVAAAHDERITRRLDDGEVDVLAGLLEKLALG